MHILWKNVNLADQILVNTVVAALLLLCLDGVELVEAEYLYILERHLVSLVAAYQLLIYAQRSAASCKTQCKRACWVCGLVSLDCIYNLVSNILCTVALGREYCCRDFFITVDDVLWSAIHNNSTVIRKRIFAFHSNVFCCFIYFSTVIMQIYKKYLKPKDKTSKKRNNLGFVFVLLH